MDMNKILAVVRESTEQQEIETQKEELEVFCKGLGYDEVEWIAVAGASACKANQKYLDMLNMIKTTITTTGIKAVAFWHLNRLGRKESYIMQMKEWFVTNHIQVHVKNPTLTLLREDGTLDAGANIAWSVFASMVAYDTEEMFAKMHRGIQRRKKEGKYGGGPVRFGYKTNSRGYLDICKEEADVINLIFEEYATRKYSLVKLAQELTNRGITMRGKRLSYQSVNMILHCDVYLGKTQLCERIVEDELWERAHEVLEGKVAKRRDKRVTNEYQYLGTKILKCKHCGHPYIASGISYICYGKNKHYMDLEDHKCESPIIHVDVIDKVLWMVACTVHLKQVVKMKDESEVEYKKQVVILKQKISTLELKLTKINEKNERNMELYVNGDVTKVLFEKHKNMIIKDRDSIVHDLDSYRRDVRRLETQIRNLSEEKNAGDRLIKESLRMGATPQERYDIVHNCIDEALIERMNGGAMLYVKCATGETSIFKYYSRPKKNHCMFYKLKGESWFPVHFESLKIE